MFIKKSITMIAGNNSEGIKDNLSTFYEILNQKKDKF